MKKQDRGGGGVRGNLRKSASDRETFKTGLYVLVCVSTALIAIFAKFPGASAQCAVRRNLPVYEPAVASRVWNVSHTDRYRLPSAMHGQYNYVAYKAAVEADGAIDKKSLLSSVGTDKVQLHMAPLYLTWKCVVQNENRNPASLSMELDSSSADGIFLVARTNDSEWQDPANFPFRCVLEPAFSPFYMLAYYDFYNAKQKFSAPEIALLYPNTSLPWVPCPGNRFTDNEILIVGPFKPKTPASDQSETRKVSMKTLDAKSSAAATRATLNVIKTVQGSAVGAHSEETNAAVHLPCELASEFKTDLDGLKKKIVDLYIEDALSGTKVVNYSRFEIAWKQNSLRPGILDASSDLCTSIMSRNVLTVSDVVTQEFWPVVFTETTKSPLINNYYQTQLPNREQCYNDASRQALYNTNSPAGRGNVRYTHQCLDQTAEAPKTDYTWSYKTLQNAYLPSPKCINHGILTHSWSATACGQRALSLISVMVQDTTAPVIDKNSKLVTWAKGKTAVALQCHWPTETTRFCIRDKIVSAVRQIYTDNCDQSSELVITPKWAHGQWYSCAKKSNGQAASCSPADGSAFKLSTSSQGGMQDLCFTKADVTVSNGAVLRYVVQVDVSDTCGNTSQGDNKILYSITFVDHLRKDMTSLRNDLCTAVV